tara:strand:- start:84 stop:647 length:564 start_codon:yes stop_codon:yes gene_type:complete
MVYLNKYKQISDEAEKSLYSLVRDLINKNTTNILEVGTYAGQVTVRLAAAAAEKNNSVRVISIDDNNDTFSPTAEESLKVSNLFNCSFESDRMEERFEENIVKANIIYIDRFHNDIEAKLEIIKKSALVPTKVIFRNPKASSDFPFEITEISPQVKPRARKKITEDTKVVANTTTKVSTKETKKETT